MDTNSGLGPAPSRGWPVRIKPFEQRDTTPAQTAPPEVGSADSINPRGPRPLSALLRITLTPVHQISRAKELIVSPILFTVRVFMIVVVSMAIRHIVLGRVPLLLLWTGGYVFFATPFCVIARHVARKMTPAPDYGPNKWYPLEARKRAVPSTMLVPDGSTKCPDQLRFETLYIRRQARKLPSNIKEKNAVGWLAWIWPLPRKNEGASNDGILASSPSSAGGDMLLEAANTGFEELLRLEGSKGTSQLACRNGKLPKSCQKSRWLVVLELVCAAAILICINISE